MSTPPDGADTTETRSRTSDQTRLLDAFRGEYPEYLGKIRAMLLGAAKAGRRLTGSELEDALCMAHNLRSAAAMVRMPEVEGAARSLETALVELRRRPASPEGDFPDGLLGILETIGTAARQSFPATDAVPPAAQQKGAAEAARESPETARRGSGSPDIHAKLLAAFQVEQQEHVESIRSFLGELEKAGGTAEPESLNEAFRRAHSLKGASRACDLRSIETLGHRLETLFARLRDGSLRADPPARDVIRALLDSIEDTAAAVFADQPLPDIRRALEDSSRLLGLEAETEAGGQDAPPEPARPARTGAPLRSVETLRVSAENLDKILDSAGQLLTECENQIVVSEHLRTVTRQIHELEREWNRIRETSAASLRRLEREPGFTGVSRYLSSLAQRVRLLSKETAHAGRLYQNSSFNLRSRGHQLQGEVRRARMVPADSVFQGFRKMVRDLAADEGKEVDFHAAGLEAKADRVVLQALKDPVMHMLRNAVSHGLETAAERRRLGKTPTGKLRLHVSTGNDDLTIVIEDDGRGIDRRRVVEVAREEGLLSGSDEPTREELARLICRPGFSTSREVSRICGRGMGLSVVHETVSRLQGRLEFPEADGPGTRVCISVPLTVSVHRLLMVSSQGQTFCIPMHGIERLLRLRGEDLQLLEGRPFVRFRQQMIPVVTLPWLLNSGSSDLALRGGCHLLVVLRSGPRQLAVAVDAFVGDRDAVLKELDAPACRVKKVAGAILLENGAVSLVLNSAQLVDGLSSASPTVSPAPSLRAPEKAPSSVLVVDDSFTARTLEVSILEANGYKVAAATDGVEALEILRSRPIDLVVTDLEMPRLDGFLLIEAMSRDKSLSKIPVIIVSSLHRPEDQQRGMDLGAAAYIVKRKFSHQQLLDTIDQIL